MKNCFVFLYCIFLGQLALQLSGCSKKDGEAPGGAVQTPTSVETPPKVLYVATGSCNSGPGITTYTTTATRTIERYLTSTGANLGYLLDYNYSGTFIAATHPKNIVDAGSYLLVLNENATTTSERRIIKVSKTDSLSFTNYFANTTALSGVMAGLAIDSEGSLLIGKTTAIEKVGPQQIRILAGANPWINAPGGNCATSTTGMSSVAVLSPVSSGISGKVIFAHQGATAALNRLGVIAGSGYFTASDCLAGVQISTTLHTKAANLAQQTVAFNAVGTGPTSTVLIPYSSGTVTAKLLVSYSNSQTSNNNAGTYNLNHGIVAWDVSEPSGTTATLTNPVVLYDNTTHIFGISAMAYDSETQSLYVATAGDPGATNQTTNGYGYNVQKFTLDLTKSTGPELTLVQPNNLPFIRGGANTKCISGMSLGE